MTEPGGAEAESTAHEHPGPASIELPAEIAAGLVAHARAEYPNEACGVVLGSGPAAEGGRALRFAAARNAARSPYRYEIDPAELLRISLDADDRDETIWGIFHSHTHTAAQPSPTDVGLAFYPDSLYLLVSLGAEHADPASGAPGLRAWRIVGGRVYEVAIRNPAPLEAR